MQIGRGEVGVVLCDVGSGWGDRYYDGLLERLEAVGFFEFS